MKTNKMSSKRYIVPRALIFSFFLSAFCFLLGCKTAEKVGTVEAGAPKEHVEFFDSMQKQAFQYKTFSARTNVDIELPGNSLSSRVDIRMVRDSAFQLSIQPFMGIEVFRLEFNIDTVKVIDRLNKRYVIESYDALKGKTPITFNFYNLQSLFSNRIFIPGEQDIPKRLYNRFTLKQEGAQAEAQIRDAMNMLYIFMADGEEKLLSTYITDKSEEYALQWTYSDFRLVDNQPFPMFMDIQVMNEGEKKGGAKIHFSKIDNNVTLNINNPMPDKYKKVTFAELIKGLRKNK